MRRGLLIVAHNLGDAVITSGYLSKLTEIPNLRWTVWCRHEVSFLFQDVPGIDEVLTNRFPVGTNKKLTWRESLRLMAAIGPLRRRNFDVSLDFIGDFRDVILGRLVNAKRHYSPVWPDGHPFRKIIRAAPTSWIPNPCAIPDATTIYEAYREIAAKVAGDLFGDSVQRPDATAAAIGVPRRKLERVGLHPFASQECKLWPASNWRSLAASLTAEGVDVIAFGAPEERDSLRKIFAGVLAEDALVCVPLREFFNRVEKLDALIGLDSFSIHVAKKFDRHSVMLNGANDPALWAPSLCTVVTSNARCGSQPCFNRPSCQNTEFEYDCMRKITADAVLKAVYDRPISLKAAGVSDAGASG